MIDERATAEVIDNDQQRETAQPGRAGFPLEPVQFAREFIRRLPLLNQVETAAVYHPNLRGLSGVGQRLFFFSHTGVEPGEVIRRADPHDAREHMHPARDEVEPFVNGWIDHD